MTLFCSQTSNTLELDAVIDGIAAFVKKQPLRFYKIIIGTDSQALSSSSLVTAITIWRVGNGAIHFWTRSEERKFATLRDRIWQEAISSITLAQEMRSRLQETLGDEFFFDCNAIHFWTRSEERKFATLRDRIWQEAISSITLAQEMRSRLQKTLGDEFFWDGNEIHVDIGENGPTKDLIDSITGMIRGYNFEPVIKPYPF